MSLSITNTHPQPFKSQGWPTLHQVSPTKINIQSKDRSRELFNDHQRENALIFRQILATNLSPNCLEISVGNLYVNHWIFSFLKWRTSPGVWISDETFLPVVKRLKKVKKKCYQRFRFSYHASPCSRPKQFSFVVWKEFHKFPDKTLS